MENRSAHVGLGPLPAVRARRAKVGRARAVVLDALAVADQPVTLAELATVTGRHENTLREHLAGLVRDGLVLRDQAAPGGRGRPSWRYRLAAPDHPGREYAGLAAALAAVIHRTSPTPMEAAVEAGQEWGTDLARAAGAPEDPSAPAARAQVVRMFGDMGFAPETDTRRDVVRLTRCPLLDTASRYPEVVCNVHLGIARGALAEYGADPSEVALHRFAEPGACLLRFQAAAAPGAPDGPLEEAGARLG